MGWASGYDVFDPVAKALIQSGASDEIKRAALGPLIEALQERGWDTEAESLGQFADDPVIVDLFAGYGITLDEDDGTDITATTHMIKAATLREFADQIDRGPTAVPMRASVFSALAREKAEDEEAAARKLRDG